MKLERQLDVPLPTTAVTNEMLTAARGMGLVHRDFATVFDVLTEQRRYLEIEQAYTAALREAWEARAALTRALGETK